MCSTITIQKNILIEQKSMSTISEEFEDTKGVIRILKSKDRQLNGQTKQDKRTNNDLQHITQKTKDRTRVTPLKTWDELRCSGRVRNTAWYMLQVLNNKEPPAFLCLNPDVNTIGLTKRIFRNKMSLKFGLISPCNIKC